MSQYQQDELSQLFARSMNFSQPLPHHPATPDKQFIMEEPSESRIIYSSQHYTGAYHICPTESTPETRADSPFSIPVEDLGDTLRRNNIDPAALSPSQTKLFANSDYEQRLRLLELWRISPPEIAGPSSSDGPWSLTSVAQEELLARLRYERRMNEQEQHQQQQQQRSTEGIEHSQEAEPYVLSGYENDQRTDPVYAAAASPGSWQTPNYAQSSMQAMEMQYGAYQHAEQMRYMQHDAFRSDDGDMMM